MQNETTGGVRVVIDKMAYETSLGGVTLNDTIDGVQFTNVNLVEGNATTIVDSNDALNALGRSNGGDDSNDNASDFVLEPPSP